MADPYSWLERPGPRVDRWVDDRHDELLADDLLLERTTQVAHHLAAAPAAPQPPDAVQSPPGGARCYRLAPDGTRVDGTALADVLDGPPDWSPVLTTADVAPEPDARLTGIVAEPSGSTRALVSVSIAGADAVRWIEVDLATGSRVPGGFDVAAGRSSVVWSGPDAVVVSRAVRTTSTSTSWLAEQWRRGAARPTPWFRADAGHPAGAVTADPTRTGRLLAVDYLDYQERRYAVGTPEADGAPCWRPLPVPGTVRVLLLGDHVVLLPTRDARVGDVPVRAGGVLLDHLERVLDGNPAPRPVTEPSAAHRVVGADVTRSHLVLTEVTPRGTHVRALDPRTGVDHVVTELPGRPRVAVRALGAACDATADLVTVQRSTPVQPDRLEVHDARHGRPAGHAVTRGRAFAHERHEVQVLELPGAHGRVPATLVGPRDLPLDGGTPLMLSAYGAFGAVERLGYLSGIGPGWLEGAPGARDGAYVLAHLGTPAAAAETPADRLVRLVEDLCAVATALCARGLTSPDRLGLYGTSHGGLVTAAAMIRHPETFGAAACGVAVLDLASYVRLGGGAWTTEYGDPDDPATWERLRTVSPLHQVRDGVRYPPTLLWTSSSDDRVAPAHARRTAERLRAAGAPVRYREETTGGHDVTDAGAAALAYGFLRRHLDHPPPPAVLTPRADAVP